jgi:hypothetical protein
MSDFSRFSNGEAKRRRLRRAPLFGVKRIYLTININFYKPLCFTSLFTNFNDVFSSIFLNFFKNITNEAMCSTV